MTGRVVSVGMQQTVVVLVENRKIHPLYKKGFLRTKRFLVDDRIGVVVGDLVEIVPCRPISKRKSWKVVRVLGKDEMVLGKQMLKETSAAAISEVMPEEEKEKEEGKRDKETEKEKKRDKEIRRQREKRGGKVKDQV